MSFLCKLVQGNMAVQKRLTYNKKERFLLSLLLLAT